MEMPDMQRYRRQVNDRRLPQAYGQNYVDAAPRRVSKSPGPGEGLETIQKAGEIMKRRQDEWDATRDRRTMNL